MTSQHDALYPAPSVPTRTRTTPRLAFADLLEEDGDSLRAAFIRTQVELAKLPEYDPLWVKCRQFDATRSSATAWPTPGRRRRRTASSGARVADLGFRRGFPWLVRVERFRVFANHAPALFDVAPIGAAHVSGRSGISELADCPHLARLTRLECSYTGLDAEDGRPARQQRARREPYRTVVRAGRHRPRRAAGADRITAVPTGHVAGVDAQLHHGRAVGRRPRGGRSAGGRSASCRSPRCGITREDAANLFALPVVRELDHLDLSGDRLKRGRRAGPGRERGHPLAARPEPAQTRCPGRPASRH